MDRTLHDRAGEVFIAARGLPGGERARVVGEMCGGDAALRAEVESLLAHDAVSSALDTPVASAVIAADGVAGLPARIGRFRVLGVLGEGGMGVVYRAEQEQPRRVVALKVMRALATTGGVRRFEREAEALARLQHPGIAAVYEVGTAETAWGACPYLAMELVEGRQITAFVEGEGLGVRQRLALIAQVADALHHAHTKGVIHRDLKPANILVQAGEGPAGAGGLDGTGSFASGPLAKILDFGVARIADERPDATMVTDPGQLVGTVRYMSPEQIGGDARAADVRSDVYALALVGYEVLTGRLPYELSEKPFAEVTRIIQDVEAAPLSRVRRELAGDAEVIFAKALEKAPGRRYASAAEFAADIRRSLADQPIMARPPSAAYQVRKFARRNRALVGAGAAAAIALVAVSGASLYAAVAASNAKDRVDVALRAETAARTSAQREAEKANRALLFIRQMLSSGRPDKDGIDTKVVEVLDAAAAEVGASFKEQPEAEAVVRQTIGLAYQALGRLTESEEHLSRAAALRSALLGEDHPDTLDTRLDLADTQNKLRKSAAARETLADVMTRLRAMPGQEDRLYTAGNLMGQVYLLERKGAEAERELRAALELAERSGVSDGRRSSALANLALAITDQGRPRDAFPVYEQAAALAERAYGPEHPHTLSARANAVSAQRRLGDAAGASVRLEKILEISRRVRGEEHLETLGLESNLAECYNDLKRYDDAVALYEHCRGLTAAQLGEENPRTLTLTNNLASGYLFTERYSEAEPLYWRVLDAQTRLHGAAHQNTMTTRNNLGRVLHKQQRYEESEQVFLSLVADADRAVPSHWLPAAFRLGLGQCQTDMRKFEEAEGNLLKALTVLEERLGRAHPHVQRTREALAALYKAWERPAEAEKYSVK